ncbi:MAG TPA: winged helix-turn-helix domain-containing protein [Casimicrobiaceae bacterium]|nr:winged helix-turn-helix domain-containing protein [Casimicrobiaceae bacterium]
MGGWAETAVEPPRTTLRIGGWSVEPGLNQISSAAGTVRLEPKAMSVLVQLAERAGEVVSREALLAAAWPGVVVGDDSLTQVVIKLRKALGDVAQKPAYIQTISKRGYRLVAPVSRSAAAVAQGSWRVGGSPDPARVPQRAVVFVVAAALLLIAAAALWGTERGRGIDSRTAGTLASADAVRDTLPTVAIRPFEALGDDPKATLLAQGMTADLLTDLAKASGLAVIAVDPLREHAGAAPRTEAPPVRYVVTGSVQRVDERLRLQVHLADATTGEQLWSERFDRPLRAFFSIQEELAPAILRILPAKVSEAELRRAARRYTHSLEAYESFLRGQAALLVRERAKNADARESFRRAIALDPAFARAYAGLALTYAADYRNQWTANGAAALDRAFEMAQTAYQMDPDIAETYWVLAFVHVERRQHQQALALLQTAVRLYPSFADGYALMGGVDTYIGRPAATVPLLRTAMRLDPEAGYLYFLLLGRAYYFLLDNEQARINVQQSLSRNPVSLESHVYMAAICVATADRACASWEAEEIRALRPGFAVRDWLDTYPMIDAAQKAMLVRALDTLEF